jgi:hypothetical protein
MDVPEKWSSALFPGFCRQASGGSVGRVTSLGGPDFSWLEK